MSYDTWKLDCNDAADLARVECVNCHDDSFRAGEMIEVAGELVCSNDCLEEFQAEHACLNCGKARVRSLVRTAQGIFCSTACVDDYLRERRAEIEQALPDGYHSSTDPGYWRAQLNKVNRIN